MPPSAFDKWSKVWTQALAGETDFAAARKFYEQAKTDPSLGLFLTGGYGVGKTSFVRALWPNTRFINCRDEAQVFRLTSEFMEAWQFDFLHGTIILDDVGQEVGVEKERTNEWQERKEIVGGFIYRWHSEYLRDMARTQQLPPRRLIITTNLSPQDFWERYGGHDVSRLKQLCYFLQFTGPDKRKFRNK